MNYDEITKITADPSNGVGCHINDRLSDTHRNNDFDTEFVT